MAAEIRTVDLDFIVKRVIRRFLCQSFAELVRQNESRLVLHVQIAAELQSRKALGRVHEDADRAKQIDEGQLAAGEDRSGGNRKLVIASLALELAARGNVVGVGAAATRANSFPVRLCPTQLAERVIGLFLATLVNRLEAEGAGLGRKKEVLCHYVLSPLP